MTTTTDTYRSPTDYEVAILQGLQNLPTVYAGFDADQKLIRPDGTVEYIPDPRIAQTDRRRARNRMGRRSRRINRIRSRR